MATSKKPQPSRWTIPLPVRLRRYFVTGLVTLLPLVVTLYLLLIIFQFADGLLGRFVNRYWLRTYGYEIPGLGLVMTIILILLIGVLSSHLFGQWAVRGFESWFGRLPVVRSIYPAIKQFSEFLLDQGGQKAAFRRAVLVQYPRAGIYSLAFVTNEHVTAATGTRTTMLTLLIPTPPSPFTGPIIFVPEQDVIPLNLSIEDALKLAVSAGVVAPPLEAAKPSRDA